MKNEVALWKQRILEREANGQTILEWCMEHNVTKGSYHYWRRQVMKAESFEAEPIVKTSPDTGPVVFAKLERNEPAPSALQVTWQDVKIHLSSIQEARLAAELITSLRRPC